MAVRASHAAMNSQVYQRKPVTRVARAIISKESADTVMFRVTIIFLSRGKS